jgi:hypothetical protein
LSPACSRARRWLTLCGEFGISRKTGYKIYDRYKDCGVHGLEARVVRLKREYPGWGAPKIREKLRQHVAAPQCPAISTVHAVLDRHGLVHRRRRRRHTATGDAVVAPD